MSALRICLIASSRFPISEPFAGGLEAHTHALAGQLRARGHAVSVFAAPGSDPALGVVELPVESFEPPPGERHDTGVTPDAWLNEHHAYLGLMLELARTGAERFDVIHNNSLHHLPIAMSGSVDVPMFTTLHTPPVPWLKSAVAYAAPGSTFVAVSDFTARAWAADVSCRIIHNGIDVDAWTPGPGGGPAVWSGRLVPEKAPHLAIDAARRIGMPLRLAGPSLDRAYFDREIAPRLGGGIEYVGHLRHHQLRAALGSATVAVVTPAWDEPYGLVAAEALACGTPVAAFARGALPEFIDESVGALARPNSVDDLARAMLAASTRDRTHVRRVAQERCSITRMVDQYERLYTGGHHRLAA